MPTEPDTDPADGEAIYLPKGGDVFVPTDLARGPWDPNAQHGGPPAALLARCIERHEPEPDLFVSRVTVELLRPVPILPLTLTTRTIRPGKRVQLVETTMREGDREIARAVGLRTRKAHLDTAPMTPPIDAPPDPDSVDNPWAGFGMPGKGFISHAVELRPVSMGSMGGAAGSGTPGKGTVWFRARVPLVAGEEIGPVSRVLMAADAQGGMSSVLDFATYTFINPDITVYLHRVPADEWVCLDAQTWVDPGGTGMAESVLFDRLGRIGRGSQALSIARR